jgi:hypothetical protein
MYNEALGVRSGIGLFISNVHCLAGVLPWAGFTLVPKQVLLGSGMIMILWRHLWIIMKYMSAETFYLSLMMFVNVHLPASFALPRVCGSSRARALCSPRSTLT